MLFTEPTFLFLFLPILIALYFATALRGRESTKQADVVLDRGSAPDPGSVACGGPDAPRRSLAGALCAPSDAQRFEAELRYTHNKSVHV